LLGDPDFPKILNTAKHGERILRFQELYQQYSRLDLSSDYDRPIAISGLQQRLLRTMGVHGGFGALDNNDNRGLLRRSLLWHRGDNVEILKPIAFPSDQENVPSWSWMAFSGGINYFPLAWNGYDWQEVESPWSSPTIALSSNAIKAWVQALDRSAARKDEIRIEFDDPSSSELPGCMAIVLGIERVSGEISDKKHYILAVKLKTSPTSESDTLYERVGAGYVPGKCLGEERKTCFLV
jgi:hypothetical protein